MKLFLWNVRGLKDPKKRELIINCIWDWKSNIVCFQEIKMEDMDDRVLRSLWGSPFLDWWKTLMIVGHSGVILLMWDKRIVEKRIVCLEYSPVPFFSIL